MVSFSCSRGCFRQVLLKKYKALCPIQAANAPSNAVRAPPCRPPPRPHQQLGVFVSKAVQFGRALGGAGPAAREGGTVDRIRHRLAVVAQAGLLGQIAACTRQGRGLLLAQRTSRGTGLAVARRPGEAKRSRHLAWGGEYKFHQSMTFMQLKSALASGLCERAHLFLEFLETRLGLRLFHQIRAQRSPTERFPGRFALFIVCCGWETDTCRGFWQERRAPTSTAARPSRAKFECPKPDSPRMLIIAARIAGAGCIQGACTVNTFCKLHF